ncbi:hypothetical protein CHS0354_024838 [Potamilus streckersoni]|uniref:Uncharacterized protein n=1 Tax=Potamilus streckersoni TaxID=2493646 RepID=A0AAE0T0S3_9BIVA|nr:hypothetical protein CHS0354_024838 [Potamilus streckersoni]
MKQFPFYSTLQRQSNAMDGNEDDAIFESDSDEKNEMQNYTLSDETDDNDDVYDDNTPITGAELYLQFGNSDTEPEFEGF